MGFFGGKKVLVAGGTGLIGRPLVKALRQQRALVTVVSMDELHDADDIRVYCIKSDLREFGNCMEACADKDIVFNLVGIKGSPSTTMKYPATFFVPTLQTQTNMMEAARRNGIKHYLHTSTVGVYPPAEIFHEDDVWNDYPSPNDRYAGWAKRMGELQAEAYTKQYNWKCSIVRPGNVYGSWDNFNQETAMVLPSLIARVVENDGPLTVWGDGSAVRDFVHAEDIAAGMMLAVEHEVHQPLNLASGVPVTIREVAELVAKHAPVAPREIIWDENKPGGDARRLMDISRAESYGYKPSVALEDGIVETIAWYVANRETAGNRYIAFEDREI